MQLTVDSGERIRALYDAPATAVEVLNQSAFDVLWTIRILSPANSPDIVLRHRIYAQQFIIVCSAIIRTDDLLPGSGDTWHHIRTAWKSFETAGCSGTATFVTAC